MHKIIFRGVVTNEIITMVVNNSTLPPVPNEGHILRTPYGLYEVMSVMWEYHEPVGVTVTVTVSATRSQK